MPTIKVAVQVLSDDGVPLYQHTLHEGAFECGLTEPSPEPPPPEPEPPDPPPPSGDIWTPPVPPTGAAVRKTLTTTWKEAIAAVGTSGGTIIVEPGIHTVTVDDAYVYTKGWNYLNIVGELDASGVAPLLDMQPNASGQKINNFIDWSGNNGNLWITNMRFHGAGSNILALGSGYRWPDRKQVVVLDNVELGYAGHHCLMFAYEFSGALSGSDRNVDVNDELWIKDCDFHHSGSTHVHYCDRIAKEVVVNSKFHDARGLSGHAFKSVARDLTVVNSQVSNVGLDGEIDTDVSHWSFRPGTPSDSYLGAVPVSIVAGQKGLWKGNRITHRTSADYNTGAYCIAQQGRHSIHGLEVPDPLDFDGEFYDPAFWATAEDWEMRFEDNEYIVLGDSNDMPRQKIYQNAGTYPVNTGFPITPIDAPAEWRERSKPICSGDKIRGFTLTGSDLYASTPYNHDRNPTDDPVGRFTIVDDPVEF